MPRRHLARYREDGLDAAEERRPEPPPDPGKIERFHQTLKRPRARKNSELQCQLDALREHYDHHRPHRALNDRTPADAYAAAPKAFPAGTITDTGHYRLRYDHVGRNGKISFCRAGRMHHLADDTTITVIHLNTGEILATNTINPDRTYWRNNEKEPGQWPDSSS